VCVRPSEAFLNSALGSTCPRPSLELFLNPVVKFKLKSRLSLEKHHSHLNLNPSLQFVQIKAVYSHRPISARIHWQTHVAIPSLLLQSASITSPSNMLARKSIAIIRLPLKILSKVDVLTCNRGDLGPRSGSAAACSFLNMMLPRL
jgi:hypothetical protein